MFELANKIAYDGAMVYGTSTPPPEKETTATLPTGWINVCGESTGNWVEAEGLALKALLAKLAREGVEAKDISVITPFQDVRNQLRAMLRQPMVFGTIHTMQGKESSVVVLVLGGNSESPGAREWAVSEPNLATLPATRAKPPLSVTGARAPGPAGRLATRRSSAPSSSRSGAGPCGTVRASSASAPVVASLATMTF